MPQPAGTPKPQDAEAFVGRSRELAVLSAAGRQSAAGDARLALVSGEPGIGKTELARAFARAAAADGALVLWGSAWEDGGAPPYWPWVQVLRSYARQSGAEALAAAAGPQTAVLAQLLPELGTAHDPAGAGPTGAGPTGTGPGGSGPGGSGDAARLTLFEAVCTVLDHASRAAPLAVILDDLHAAGRPSALLLRFAATARLSRIVLLATYRTAEAALDPDVSDVIAALESVSPPLVLAGLSAEDIRLMLPGAGDDTLAVVRRRSEGNPLFVSQVARLLGPGAAAVEEVPVPAGIRQAVRRQVARLRAPGADAGDGIPAAEEILATAAALGPDIDPAVVAAALGAPPGPVARLCDDATAAGLLAPGRDTGAVYRFRHALIRETLYAELAPQARAQAHYKIAEVLENTLPGNTSGRSHAELAYHFLRAAPASAEAAARAVHHSRLAGQEALSALAYEEAADHFRHALDVQRRTARSTPASRAGLLLSLAEALTKTGPDPAAARATDEAVRLARHAGEPRLLAAAALLNAQHLDFNAPADTATALLREAAAALGPADHALRARTLARLAITLAPEPPAARAAADQAVKDARQAVAADPVSPAAATALASSLVARHYVLWGTQDPADALAAADEIITAARRAREPETELDGRVLRLTHLLELGDGPAAQRVLPELDRMAEALRQPAVRLTALSRRSTLAALAGDFAPAVEFARQAFQTGQAASLPDAGAVYWGQLFAVWLHTDLPDGDEQWMERELRSLVARSYLSVAHAAALVQIEAAHGAADQARARLDELVEAGLDRLRPDMLFLWALTLLARGCVVLRAAGHAPRLYRALAPYAGRAAVAAGAVMCSGSTDFYLGGLAALGGDTTAAGRHYRMAAGCHRRLDARPMLALTLHEHAPLLRQQGNHAAASAALAEARAIATDCGMTRLLSALSRPGPPEQPATAVTLRHEDDFWLVGFAGAITRIPDSLGLRYLDVLVRQPGRELSALDLVQAVAAGPAGTGAVASTTASADGLHDVSAAPADFVIDQQARAAYRQRLTALDEDLAEAEQWNDTERASRLRAEKDFLAHELAAAVGLGGRPRRLGAESERARLNVTRAIRSAIGRIRDRAPAAAAHLDQAVRTGTRCSYSPPDG
jgi:AAA ATPase-like protein